MLQQYFVQIAIGAILFGWTSKSQSPDNQNPCYFMNGTDFGDYHKADEYVPCNLGSGGGNNMCCILNPPGPNFGKLSPDVCLPNGLCLMREWPENAEKFGSHERYYRNFCSDRDRTKCLDVCGDWPSEMTPCGSSWNTTRWCCGDDDSCCTNETDPKLVTIPLSRLPVSTSTTNDCPSLPTRGPEGPEVTAFRESGMTVGAKVGIGIGAAVGTLALFGLGFVGGLQFMKNRVQSSRPTEISPPLEIKHLGNDSVYEKRQPLPANAYMHPGPHPQYMDITPRLEGPQELDTNRSPSELHPSGSKSN